jgi:putative transposase
MRPKRLVGVSYDGFQRYLATTCTSSRHVAFRSAAVVDMALDQILHTAHAHEMAIPAYCFMPDHLHLVVAGRSEQSDFRRFMKAFKQVSGFQYRQGHRRVLWQEGYHERVLRDDEATETVVRYVLENPIRAGLTTRLGEYPFAGSCEYEMEDLLVLWERRT